MWLDPERYSAYKPLLTVGKAAAVVCLLPMAAAIARDPGALGSAFGIPRFGLLLAFFIAAVDVASLCILALSPSHPGEARPPDGPQKAGKSAPGQGPEDIEQVEA
jgi:hypothetical protein